MRNIRKHKVIILIIIALLALSVIMAYSCKKKEPAPPPYEPTPYTIEIPFGFPTDLNIPDDNPMTVEGIELGRYLFYDGRLSGRTHPDSLMSCGTCHLQAKSFECGIDHAEFLGGFPHGITGKPTPHVMLPMVNLLWNHTGYLWNGAVQNIEDIVWIGITAEHEMNADTNRVKELFQKIPGYPTLFGKAFGSETVTMKNIGRAIAQFIRTINLSQFEI